jgi:hypothetical protein
VRYLLNLNSLLYAKRIVGSELKPLDLNVEKVIMDNVESSRNFRRGSERYVLSNGGMVNSKGKPKKLVEKSLPVFLYLPQNLDEVNSGFTTGV